MDLWGNKHTMIGNGIILVAVAVMIWLIIDWLGDSWKKATRPDPHFEWHESLLADGDERMVRRPTGEITPVRKPLYQREINEILTWMETEEERKEL